MSSYAVIFLQTIGIQDVYKITVLIMFTFGASCMFAFYFPDKVGRRWLMIVCSVVMASCLFVVSGIAGFGLAEDENAMKGALCALFFWWFFSALGWSSWYVNPLKIMVFWPLTTNTYPSTWIVTAEIPTLQLREKTIMLGTVSGFSVSILVTFVNPFIQEVGYGGLEGRVGFVYGGFSVLAAVWCLFMLPETGSRTLEELDELFAAEVSVWKFSKYKTNGFGAQIAQIEGTEIPYDGSKLDKEAAFAVTEGRTQGLV
jgi:hypothetical protein